MSQTLSWYLGTALMFRRGGQVGLSKSFPRLLVCAGGVVERRGGVDQKPEQQRQFHRYRFSCDLDRIKLVCPILVCRISDLRRARIAAGSLNPGFGWYLTFSSRRLRRPCHPPI